MNAIEDYNSPKLFWSCPNCHRRHFVELPDFVNATQGGRLLVCTDCYHYYKVEVTLLDYSASLTTREAASGACPKCGGTGRIKGAKKSYPCGKCGGSGQA